MVTCASIAQKSRLSALTVASFRRLQRTTPYLKRFLNTVNTTKTLASAASELNTGIVGYSTVFSSNAAQAKNMRVSGPRPEGCVLGPGKTRTHCGGNIVSCVAKRGNIVARRADTRNVYEDFQKHALCPGHKCWQNESTFVKYDQVSNVAATMCPRFADPLALIWDIRWSHRTFQWPFNGIAGSMTETGQRPSPWPCKVGESRDKISFRVQALLSL